MFLSELMVSLNLQRKNLGNSKQNVYLHQELFYNLFYDKKHDVTYSKADSWLCKQGKKQKRTCVWLVFSCLLFLFLKLGSTWIIRTFLLKYSREKFNLRDKFKSQFLSLPYFQQSILLEKEI